MLTLALPKGRLLEPALTLLAGMGIRGFEPDSRRLLQADDAAGLRFILLKPAHVPTHLEHGAAHLGILGKDILLEQQPDVYQPVDPGFGFSPPVGARTRQAWGREAPRGAGRGGGGGAGRRAGGGGAGRGPGPPRRGARPLVRAPPPSAGGPPPAAARGLGRGAPAAAGRVVRPMERAPAERVVG